MKKRSINTIVSLAMLTAGTSSAALVGLWEFNDSGDLGKATVGTDATLDTATYGGAAITSTAGVTGGDGAAAVPVDSMLAINNPIGVNGGGTTRTNEYTIVFDIQIPTLANWVSQISTDRSGDGDYFYSTSRGLGVSSEGYVDDSDPPSLVTANVWHRFVISVDNGTARTTYVDGVDGSTVNGGHGSGGLDSRWSLTTVFDMFSDNGGNEEALTNVSNLALYDTALSAAEVTALGAVGTSLAPVPEPSSAALLGLGGLALIMRRRK
ncbi:MAG: LamG-like jellyroll fold domain-containing protein [Akkermansiaceae bacterium]